MSDIFYNQPGRVARYLLILALPLLILGLPGAIYTFSHPHTTGPEFTTVEGWALAGTIAVPIASGLLFSAVLTLPSAWRADKIFAEFNAGKYLARWKYDDAYWQAYIDGESRRLRKVSNFAFCLVIGTGLFAFTIMWLNMPNTPRGKLEAAAVIIAIAMSGAFGLRGLVRAYSNNRARRLARCGEAIIAPHAAYMGGDFAFWGYGIRALQGARFIPGDPAMIELVVGLTDVAKTASRVIDMVGVLALSPINSAQMSQRQLVPVPPGGEAAAIELIRQIGELNFPPAPAQVTAPNVPTPHPKPEKIHTPITIQTLQRRTRRWWHITASLAIVGFSLFMTAVIIDINASPNGHSPGDSLSVWGFVIFFMSFFALPIAIFKSIKFRRARQHEPIQST